MHNVDQGICDDSRLTGVREDRQETACGTAPGSDFHAG